MLLTPSYSMILDLIIVNPPYIIYQSHFYVKPLYRFTTYETNKCVAPPKIVKQRFYVKYDSCNTPLQPELVCGIHVQNEGNRIEF